MSRCRVAIISRHGISWWAAFNDAETLPAASPMISSDRTTAFWCNGLARNAVASSPLTKDSASPAASFMSSRRAASRPSGSAIDHLGFGQDMAAPDIVSAGLDRLALGQIDRAAKQRLQILGEAEKLSQRRHVTSRLEINQKVRVAARRV